MGHAQAGNRLVVWRSRLMTEHGWVTQVLIARPEDPPPNPAAELLGEVGESTWHRLEEYVPEVVLPRRAPSS